MFTEKENGIRGWIIHSKGQTKFFSRNYSDVDCSVPEYWDNVYQTPNFPETDTWVFDCEVKFDGGYLLQEELKKFGLATDSKLEAMASLLQMHSKDAIEIQRKFKEDKGFDLIPPFLRYSIISSITFIPSPRGLSM